MHLGAPVAAAAGRHVAPPPSSSSVPDVTSPSPKAAAAAAARCRAPTAETSVLNPERCKLLAGTLRSRRHPVVRLCVASLSDPCGEQQHPASAPASSTLYAAHSNCISPSSAAASPAAAPPSRHMERLPDEVFAAVCGYVHTRERVHAVGAVCRAWRAASDAAPWRLSDRDLSKALVADAARCPAALARLCFVRRLNVASLVLKCADAAAVVLAAYLRFTSTHPRDVAARAPVEATVLAELTEACYPALRVLAPRLQRLYVLTFKPPPCLPQLSFPRLRHFTARQLDGPAAWQTLPDALACLTVTRFVGGADLAANLPRFSRLVELKVATVFCRDGFGAIAASCPVLRKLDLSGTRVDAESLKEILARCPLLRTLVVNGVESPANLPAGLHGAGIAEVLSGRAGGGGGGGGGRTPPGWNLEHVFVKGMGGLDNRALRCLFSSLARLRSLKLNTGKDITDEGFCGGLVPDGTRPFRIPACLESIQVSDCRHLTDRSLQALSAASSLTELSLFCCQMMTPKGVTTVAEQCKALRAFCLYIPRVEAASVASASSSAASPPGWTESAFHVVDDASARALLALPELETFKVYSCGALTAAAFPAASDAKPRLKTLELDYSLALPQAAATHRAIAAAFPSLQKLSLKSNEAVVSDTATVEDFLRIPNLQCLRVCLRELGHLKAVLTKASIAIKDVDLFGCSRSEYEQRFEGVICASLFPGSKPSYLPSLPCAGSAPHVAVFREGEFFDGGNGKKLRVLFTDQRRNS